MTGAKPSDTVIDKGWATLPATVETASKCPNGVARVETRESFWNGLVAVLTFQIYTTMSIKVTCAAAN